MIRRKVRVPASSANLGPGFDCMAAALALHLELEVEETGEFAVETELPVAARAREPLRAGVRAAASGGRLHLQDPLGDPARGRAGVERRGDRRRPDGRRPPVRARRRPAGAGERARGPPRQRRGGAARRLRRLRRRARRRASSRRPGLEALAVVPEQAVRTRAARAALPAEVPLEEAVFNVAHGALLTLGLARGDWDLLARGLQDRLHEQRRAELFPRSYELALRATRAGRARRDDLRRRARRCSCGASTSRPARSPRRCAERSTAGRHCCATPFEPQGAYVGEL